MFVVVLSTLVINTIIQKGPVVFLSLAEQKYGQIDAQIFPYGRAKYENGTKTLYFNTSRVDEALGKEQFLFSPRTSFAYGFAQAVLDGASGLYDPEDAKSVEMYQESFNELGLPSREQIMAAKFE